MLKCGSTIINVICTKNGFSAPALVVYLYYRKVSQGQQAENQRQPVANFTHFLILIPDDFMQETK